LDSINEGVFTVDLNWRIASFNRAAEKITGISRENATGHRCSEVFRANICSNACVMRSVLETGEPAVNAAVFVVDAWGARIPIKVSAAVLHDIDGRVIDAVLFQNWIAHERGRADLVDHGLTVAPDQREHALDATHGALSIAPMHGLAQSADLAAS
jgi:PAS domain S-box-containing protein